MTSEAHPAGANIRYLKQGAELIRQLADKVFFSSPEKPYRGGVGAQFRHCLDFYDCFLDGLEAGTIDYNSRRRDPQLETDREHALHKIDSVCEALAGLTREQIACALDVRAEQSADDATHSTPSSAGRELQFLISHTIHHYALIAVMLKAQGHDVARDHPDFGVAPSTLAHWKENGSLVS